ncbi:hypothetical protein PCE1_004759 [Barthelona sp. PCE]
MNKENNDWKYTCLTSQSHNHCAFCHKSIDGSKFAKCLSCKSMHCCMDCLHACKDSELHQVDHEFVIMVQGLPHLYDMEWTAFEEIFLLEGVKLFGPTNFEQIAGHIGSRTAEECRERILTYYLRDIEEFDPEEVIEKVQENSEEWDKLQELIDNGEVMPPDLLCPLPIGPPKPIRKPTGLSKVLQREVDQPPNTRSYVPPILPPDHVSVGFNARREEFDFQWDFDAEKALVTVEFDEKDSEEDIRMKMEILHACNRRLLSREEMTTFVLKNELFKTRQRSFKLTPSKRREQILPSIKVFSRFIDSNKLIDIYHKEMELQKLTNKLKEFSKLEKSSRTKSNAVFGKYKEDMESEFGLISKSQMR